MVLTQFRAAAGQRPDDPRFTEIVTVLTATSPEFREWWPEYQVRHFKPATIEINHPDAGRLQLEMLQLRPVDRPDLLMVLQIPATPDDLRRVSAPLEDANHQ